MVVVVRSLCANARIGFSNNKDVKTYKVENERTKLTIEEMNS